MWWTPTQEWKGKAAYIIGGGPSLQTFNWDLLRGRMTIGCNSAYLLGPEICRVCFFGDRGFWQKYRQELQAYHDAGGVVVTNVSLQADDSSDWLRRMGRVTRGLGQGNALGWNHNSGCAATNLALSLGADPIYLLGIDLSPSDKKHNWHDRENGPMSATYYQRFAAGFTAVARDVPRVFGQRKIVCVTDTAQQTIFPTETIKIHFGV